MFVRLSFDYQKKTMTNNDAVLRKPPYDPLSFIESSQIEYLIKLKKEEYRRVLNSIRYRCDSKIRKSASKNKLPIKFKIPHSDIPKEFNKNILTKDLMDMLTRDGFKVKVANRKDYILHILPTTDIDCKFLNLDLDSFYNSERKKNPTPITTATTTTLTTATTTTTNNKSVPIVPNGKQPTYNNKQIRTSPDRFP